MMTREDMVILKSSPHLKRPVTTDQIMLNVVYALLPVSAFAVYCYGLSGLLLLMTSTAAAVVTEHLYCKFSGKQTTVTDYSAVITGLLLGLTLPPAFPLWMAAAGSAISIGLGKLLFGGLGFNPFNPALVGRAFLQAAFPVAITTWTPVFMPGRFTHVVPSSLALPFMKAPPVKDFYTAMGIDGWSGATPFALKKFENVSTDIWDMFIGSTEGSLGETSDFLIIICGLYLIYRGMMEWRIPVAMLSSVFLLSSCFYFAAPDKYPGPVFMLFSGGLMLGAVFMATDMVASSTTKRGVWIYGAFIGAVTVIIRLKGGLPEGVMYAILLGNALVPLIDQVTQPRIFGARKREKAKAAS